MADMQMEISELIGRISQRARQGMATAMDQVDLAGLTPYQARVLGYIQANEDAGLIQRDIADVMGTRAASVSSLLQALERSGWIERHADPRDSRRKTLHTTARGRELVTRFESDIWAAARLPLDGLSPSEIEDLHRLLTRLDRSLAD